MLGDNASLIELLTEALTKSQTLTKQAEEQTETIDRLFRQCAEKDIEIASLKRNLKVAQAKEQKWRLEQPHLSSPVMSDEAEPPVRTSRPSTPTLPLEKHISPKSSLHVQVFSSPPRKRQRISTIEKTPLQEVTNSRSVPRGPDRIQKAIEAIPRIAEDGDWDHRNVKGGKDRSRKSEGDRYGAQHRLNALLDAPTPQNDVLGRRPISVSPKAKLKANNAQPPSLQRSSSDSGRAEKPPMRRKPPFLPPKPPQQNEHTPLRSRRLSNLQVSDFVSRPGFLEEWERPRARQKFTYHPHQMSDEEVLLDYLGPGGREKLASMTRNARDNLLYDARLRKMANRIDEARNSTKQAGNGPTYWDIDFPPSQEEERHRAERVQSLREEVNSRYQEALGANGRWQFRDEVNAR